MNIDKRNEVEVNENWGYWVDQIDGDLDNLIGNPLLMAEETIQEGDTD